jgi:T4 gene Gp59 loader of gp41 DNA helicase C-term/T4 gene Gp59 loader of gp41 DNA helicase
MSASDAAIKYNALKLHFNTEQYDAIKYNFKVKLKPIPQGHYYIFDKLDKKYGENLVDFYVSNFLEDQKVWINDLLSEDCHLVYLKWLKKKDSLTYIYKNDIIDLLEEYEDLNKVLIVKNSYPILMNRVLQEKTNLETLLLVNSIVKFFNTWDKKLKGDLIWEPFALKCKKYYGFLKFDRDKVKDILVKEVKMR